MLIHALQVLDKAVQLLYGIGWRSLLPRVCKQHRKVEVLDKRFGGACMSRTSRGSSMRLGTFNTYSTTDPSSPAAHSQ